MFSDVLRYEKKFRNLAKFLISYVQVWDHKEESETIGLYSKNRVCLKVSMRAPRRRKIHYMREGSEHKM